MNDETRDPQLQALFNKAQTDLPGSNFVQQALNQTRQLQRRAKIHRMATAILVFLSALLLQDFSLDLSQMLMISLIDLPENIATTILAPVNSLGGVLTAVLICLRITYRRLYR